MQEIGCIEAYNDYRDSFQTLLVSDKNRTIFLLEWDNPIFVQTIAIDEIRQPERHKKRVTGAAAQPGYGTVSQTLQIQERKQGAPHLFAL